MVEEAERFVDVDTQIFNLTLCDYSGVHHSEGRVGGKADVFVFAGKGEAVEEF
jgi:hypothetical protein